METLSILTLKKFKDVTERILHVPGNYRGGILEMAVVVDNRLSEADVRGMLPQLLKALKQHGQIFSNVRFNYVVWGAQKIQTKVCPMMQAVMESFYQDYVEETGDRDFCILIDHLKLFQARAKVIILLTAEEKEAFRNSDELKKRMQPFLDKKMMFVHRQEDGIAICYRDKEV